MSMVAVFPSTWHNTSGRLNALPPLTISCCCYASTFDPFSGSLSLEVFQLSWPWVASADHRVTPQPAWYPASVVERVAVVGVQGGSCVCLLVWYPALMRGRVVGWGDHEHPLLFSFPLHAGDLRLRYQWSCGGSGPWPFCNIELLCRMFHSSCSRRRGRLR